jgi:hypothetical protein
VIFRPINDNGVLTIPPVPPSFDTELACRLAIALSETVAGARIDWPASFAVFTGSLYDEKMGMGGPNGFLADAPKGFPNPQFG